MVLFEVKGIRAYQESNINQVSFKHYKTVTDIHASSVVALKFYGDLSPSSKKISVVSSDLDGIVYLTHFTPTIISYSCNKQCFMKKRIGPTFSIAPFSLSPRKDYDLKPVVETEVTNDK